MEQALTMASTAIDMDRQHEALLRVLAAATFIIFFQAFMVAPIIPRLAATFAVSPHQTGFIVPAYLIPYGAATLAYGLLADRIGIWRIMIASLCAFALLTILTATAQSITQMVFWRFLTGLGASGVVPLALVMIGRLFPYERRGRPLGWLFGAMAGGMAFGSTIGAVLEPYTGWRVIFIGVGIAGAGTLFVLLPYRNLFAGATQSIRGGWKTLFHAYRSLFTSARGQRTYLFVFVNSIFHSGVFTWLGLYFERRYGLGPVGIGLALLGYGLPGFLFGPLIGHAADRFGRGRLLPLGLGLGALAAVSLIPNTPLFVAALAVTMLSLGYDMTQPLFAGIVTTLGGQRPGQAMGLNVFMLFTGFGLGSLLFGEMLRGLDFDMVLTLSAMVEGVLCLLSFRLFRAEAAVPRTP